MPKEAILESPTKLTPLQLPDGHVPGRYASIDVSPEPMFGPAELTGYTAAIKDLTDSVTKADASPRIFEVLQAWEARLFERAYQFLLSKGKGFAMFSGGGAASPNAILAAGNAGKLFPVNVYGARADKITAALSREIPGLKFEPEEPDSPVDQTTAEASDSYINIWIHDAKIKGVLARVCRLFYTDDRVVLWTRSVADQQRWGTETPEKDTVFGEDEPEGVTPETELQGEDAEQQGEQPAICEVTTAHGKLESKVPIYCDELTEMGTARLAFEVDVDILRERYPWIEEKIEGGQTSEGADSMDRQARVNVRMAVQNQSSSGESFLKDATEIHTWFRPSQYRAIKNEADRQVFYDNFPKGLRLTHAGSALAFARNEGMDQHLEILHPRDGDGQNRRAIGTNYLPIQKILNQNIGLLVRYFVSCVPRRFAAEGPIDVQAINGQPADPSIVTPVVMEPGQRISDLTGIENVPTPTTGLMEFVEWLVSGAPEVMDGATPTMFGEGDVGTVGESTLNRDQSLQVFSAPWGAICHGLANAATQAAQCAAANRVRNIRSRTPGQAKLTVELENLQGKARCYPVSLELPQTLAEQEARAAGLIEQSANVKLYADIVNNPLNLQYFSEMPSLEGLNIPGLDAVEKQQGEFEELMDSGPIDNPELGAAMEQIQKLTALVQKGATEPDAQTPRGQQVLQQMQQQLTTLQQQVQTLPPLVSSVPVAQDGSEDHAIEGAVVLQKMNSADGRKLRNGNDQQKAIFQNLTLHWQAHMAMAKKLTPVPPLMPKVSVTAALDKAPPEVQAQGWAALGVEAGPDAFVNQNTMVPHETTVEQEGVDANGVPIKTKTSTVNTNGKLS